MQDTQLLEELLAEAHTKDQNRVIDLFAACKKYVVLNNYFTFLFQSLEYFSAAEELNRVRSSVCRDYIFFDEIPGWYVEK
ncbi:MAG TPA: hypothetical protein VJB08_01135 [Candidatus Nanoarchaeia archaeon]|nr:hypothetical protein [Candidatus Nanoarchaeia archaeon]